MTRIIIMTGADRRRAEEISHLFEGGNRVEVLGILAEGSVIPEGTEWVVYDNAADTEMPEGVRAVRLAPDRTPPESAADILAAIRGAEAEADPDTAWARTLGVNRAERPVPPPVPRGESAVSGAGLKQGEGGRTQCGTPGQIQGQTPGQIPGGTPAGEPAGIPAVPGSREEPMPPTYLVWSVVMTVLCCMPAGVVAIVFSSLVSSRYYTGDTEGSRRASRMAEIWIIISFVAGVITGTLYLPMLLAGVI